MGFPNPLVTLTPVQISQIIAAVPSAAANAAATAAAVPTIGAITAVVPTPSAIVGAAAAGAVPTATQTAAVVPTVPKFSLLSSQALSGLTTYTFSGLSGYSKYKVVVSLAGWSTAADYIALRINGDTGNNYGNEIAGYSSIGLCASVANGTQISAEAEIQDALILAPKTVQALSTISPYPLTQWIHANISAVTSITVFMNGGHTFLQGSVYLKGAN